MERYRPDCDDFNNPWYAFNNSFRHSSLDCAATEFARANLRSPGEVIAAAISLSDVQVPEGTDFPDLSDVFGSFPCWFP